MSQRLPRPPYVCYLCLSKYRKIFCLSSSPNIRQIFGFLTGWYPQMDARVCWECRAVLERIRRFKQQAQKAVDALESARTGKRADFKCLSKICITETLVVDLLVYDNGNEYSKEIFPDSTNKRTDKTAEETRARIESDEYINKNNKQKEILNIGVDEIKVTTHDHNQSAIDNQGDNSTKTVDLTSEDDIQSQSKLAIQITESVMPLATSNAPVLNAERGSVSNLDIEELVRKKAKELVEIKIKEYRAKKQQRARANKRERERVNSPILKGVSAVPSSDAVEKKECTSLLEKALTGQKVQILSNTQIRKAMIKPNENEESVDVKIEEDPRPSEAPIDTERAVEQPGQALNQRGTRFECDHCDEVFTEYSLIVQHLREHSKRAKCEQCAFVCKTQGGLRKHMLVHHNLIPRRRDAIQCEMCNKKFTDKFRYFVHKNTHTSKRPFKCDMCNKTFIRKRDLILHINFYKSMKISCIESTRTELSFQEGIKS